MEAKAQAKASVLLAASQDRWPKIAAQEVAKAREQQPVARAIDAAGTPSEQEAPSGLVQVGRKSVKTIICDRALALKSSICR